MCEERMPEERCERRGRQGARTSGGKDAHRQPRLPLQRLLEHEAHVLLIVDGTATVSVQLVA